MAMIYRALQLKSIPGRWRVRGRDDDASYIELCECENGHEDQAAAYACPTVACRLGELFPDGMPSNRFVEDLDTRGVLLLEAFHVLYAVEPMIAPLSNADLIRRIGKNIGRPVE